jgi:hypothetical protein
MGINIVLVDLVRKEKDHGYTYFITDRIGWFDSYRHSGDRAFRQYLYKNSESISENDYIDNIELGATVLWRISRYDECRRWIKDNIVKVNQKRLLDAINYMEQHKDIYFDFR